MEEFTDDVALNVQLTQSQFALAILGTIISVFAALLPMPNGERVQANIAYLGELAGRKGGEKPPTPVPERPNTPATPDDNIPNFPTDPQDDPQPASNLDYTFLDPSSNVPIPEIFQKGLPHEPPPPGSWQIGEDEGGIGKTPHPGKAGYFTLAGTIPGTSQHFSKLPKIWLMFCAGTILTGSQTLWAKYDVSHCSAMKICAKNESQTPSILHSKVASGNLLYQT